MVFIYSSIAASVVMMMHAGMDLDGIADWAKGQLRPVGRRRREGERVGSDPRPTYHSNDDDDDDDERIIGW